MRGVNPWDLAARLVAGVAMVVAIDVGSVPLAITGAAVYITAALDAYQRPGHHP